MTEESNNQLAKAAEMLEKFARPILNAITVALPHIITYSKKAHAYYVKLPKDYLNLLIGCVFCFFGGIYPTIFAAIEAAKHGGMDTLRESFKILSEEALVIIEASKKDDDLDDDNDGKKDVEQIDGKEFIMRKAKLVLAKMNPQKVDKALSAVYSVWLSVMAVLSMQFAKTIALALSISNFIKIPVNRHITPLLQQVTPDEYHRWIPVVVGWIAKSIAISIAWYIQTIISAIASAMTGAIMISRILLKICFEKGYTLGGIIPESDKDTQIDEMASYVFAFFGFYVQWKMNFSVPFPLNILLFPLGCCETFIRWSITK